MYEKINQNFKYPSNLLYSLGFVRAIEFDEEEVDKAIKYLLAKYVEVKNKKRADQIEYIFFQYIKERRTQTSIAQELKVSSSLIHSVIAEIIMFLRRRNSMTIIAMGLDDYLWLKSQKLKNYKY